VPLQQADEVVDVDGENRAIASAYGAYEGASVMAAVVELGVLQYAPLLYGPLLLFW